MSSDDIDPTEAPARPRLPAEHLNRWVETDDQVERVFSLGPVDVTAHTVVFDDTALRERIREVAGIDVGRFVFATRLSIRPSSGASRSLTRLVNDRSKAGFVDRLLGRGFESVEAVGSRTLRVGEWDVDVAQYAGRLPRDGATLAVAGWLAVRPVDGEFLLVGGAYPTSVVEGGEEVTDALRSLLRPDEWRAELFDLVRGAE